MTSCLRNIGCSNFKLRLLDLILIHGHLDRLEVTWNKMQNSCQVIIFLMEKHWKILHQKRCFDLRVRKQFFIIFNYWLNGFVLLHVIDGNQEIVTEISRYCLLMIFQLKNNFLKVFKNRCINIDGTVVKLLFLVFTVWSYTYVNVLHMQLHVQLTRNIDPYCLKYSVADSGENISLEETSIKFCMKVFRTLLE